MGKVTRREWNFVLKELGDDTGPVLKEEEANFLFKWLDKDRSGEITKYNFEAFIGGVVMKFMETDSPREILRKAFETAEAESQRMGGIDYQVQKLLLKAETTLTKHIENMSFTKQCYNKALTKAEAVTEERAAGRSPSTNVFASPKKRYEEDLEGWKKTIEIGNDRLKAQYRDVMVKINEAEAVTQEVNDMVRIFVEQGAELGYLRERDSHCCRMACLLCC